MSLQQLVNNSRTDKNTTHTYLPLYDVLLERLKYSAKNVLEVGVHKGGSILLWKDFFENATIYGLDVLSKLSIPQDLFEESRILLHLETDAYNTKFFQETFLDKNLTFDFMLDDGPHTLESQLNFVKLYSQLLTKNGILIVEDVQSMDWLPQLIQETPDHLKQYIRTYDLRKNKNRYDDIVFTIDKREI